MIIDCRLQLILQSGTAINCHPVASNCCLYHITGPFKDPNFEFLSTWNMSEYEDEAGTAVTEMTDDQLQKLGFPLPSSDPSDSLARPPSDSVINNPFITFVSRKY